MQERRRLPALHLVLWILPYRSMVLGSRHLRPLTIIHPFFYPQIGRCPCGNKRPLWEGWTTTGHRDVHGLRQEETALGFRIRCKECHGESQGKTNRDGYCIATTNPLYWEKWDNACAGGLPYFFKRCAVTSDLFQLISEMRPLSTAAGLRISSRMFTLFSVNVRVLASPLILSLLAKTLSLDATFKFANRATVVDKDGKRHKLVKGGILSMINEHNLTVGWVRTTLGCVANRPA